MYDFTPTGASLQQLPPHAFSQLSPALSLLGMACKQLFATEASPLPGAVTSLTRLNAATVAELNAIQSTEALQELLNTRPLQLYNLVLVGRAALHSPLAAPVHHFLRQQMQVEGEPLTVLWDYCLGLTAALENALEQLIAGPSGAAALAPLRHRQQQLQQLFDTHSPSLVPPAPAIVTLGFDEARLQMLRLALLLVQSLPQTEAEHPFLQAVATLPHLQPTAVEPLMARLGHITAEERLPLSLSELTVLYQAMHVCGLVFVSDVLSSLGLEGAMPMPEAGANPDATSGSSRQAVGALVASFTQWVQREFGEEPAIQQARQEIFGLTETL
ncbi:hypothetical protein PK28_15030 [Hymenobacter sp. DG25B]|uniref:hypothetical protein n=1 Tax=Hymenobacter sp. DG25B TaxID=1385664 RepID=UPI0005410FA3|nr:hypothetical protein [Hymenobacter sp. DG25B]AIZ64655.1 hypothetical protein PK28_15030 [Hymenobacter sp. DG25B]